MEHVAHMRANAHVTPAARLAAGTMNEPPFSGYAAGICESVEGV